MTQPLVAQASACDVPVLDAPNRVGQVPDLSQQGPTRPPKEPRPSGAVSPDVFESVDVWSLEEPQ